jgi:hypothetical protein
MQVPAMRNALARARAAAVERAGITVDSIVVKLERAYEVALASEPAQTSGAVAAQMGIAKLLGLVIDRGQLDVVHHKPSLLPTKQLELSREEWEKTFVTGRNDR